MALMEGGGTTVTPVHHLVGVREIMAMFRLSRQRVDQLAAEPDFPVPTATLAQGRVWERTDIEDWARSTGREIADS